MSIEQVERLRAMLAGRPKDAPLAARRAGFEAMMARLPLPGDLSVEPVDAGGVPGLLLTRAGGDPTRVLLWLHGGQFAIGSAASYRPFGAEVAAAAGCAVLLLDYRLAPEHPFPAALDDTRAALGWLAERGVGIQVGGDSAGANLAAVALQADGCPPVAACWLLSPYLDLTHSGASIAARHAVDPFVDPAEMDAVAARYLGAARPDDMRASPLLGPVDTFPPTLVQVGSDEALFDDAARFARRLEAAGRPVTFQEWVGMIHVWPLFAAQIDEGGWAIAQGGAFLRRNEKLQP